MAKAKAKAKRASKQSSSTPTQMAADGKMVLRIRTRSTKQAVEVIKEQTIRPRSAKKPKTNKAAKLDTKKPKKPPTAFFYFLEDFRKGFQEQNPDVKSMRDVGKACGQKWKTMNYEEKVQYYDIATEKRAEFDRAMADYTKRMESGEEQELEQDSEFDE